MGSFFLLVFYWKFKCRTNSKQKWIQCKEKLLELRRSLVYIQSKRQIEVIIRQGVHYITTIKLNCCSIQAKQYVISNLSLSFPAHSIPGDDRAAIPQWTGLHEQWKQQASLPADDQRCAATGKGKNWFCEAVIGRLHDNP